MNQKACLLYIGSLNKRSNSYRRFVILSSLCKAQAIDTDGYLFMQFLSGIQHHLNIGPGIFLLNKKIRKAVSAEKYDIVFVDNKPYLNKATLRFINQQPAIKIVNLLTDDPFGNYSKSWRLFKRTVSLYDYFFVQRKVNIEELKNRGARRVALCYRSFDPEYNKPVVLNGDDIAKYKTGVGFIGTYEKYREEYIVYLTQNNIAVTVTGDGWPRGKYWDIIAPYYKGPSVYGEEYIKAINGMDIALHFLRHANRDEQDSRTFEIPACKVFMLAERSDVHESLFEDGKEAVFFTVKEQLLKKVVYYLNHEGERKRIAENGFKKCYDAGYSHAERMKMVIETTLK